MKFTQVFQCVYRIEKSLKPTKTYQSDMHANDVLPVAKRISTFLEHFRAFRNHAICLSPHKRIKYLIHVLLDDDDDDDDDSTKNYSKMIWMPTPAHTCDSHFQMLKLLDGFTNNFKCSYSMHFINWMHPNRICMQLFLVMTSEIG